VRDHRGHRMALLPQCRRVRGSRARCGGAAPGLPELRHADDLLVRLLTDRPRQRRPTDLGAAVQVHPVRRQPWPGPDVLPARASLRCRGHRPSGGGDRSWRPDAPGGQGRRVPVYDGPGLATPPSRPWAGAGCRLRRPGRRTRRARTGAGGSGRTGGNAGPGLRVGDGPGPLRRRGGRAVAVLERGERRGGAVHHHGHAVAIWSEEGV